MRGLRNRVLPPGRTSRAAQPVCTRGMTVIVGVDTHTHIHVAVAIDTWGIRLGDRSCLPPTQTATNSFITWAERHGRVAAFGIEGTGSYGAGLARAA